MSKDKYSNNHTIEITGDTNKLIIKNNLEIVGDATVGDDLTVTGDLVANTLATASGDLDISGDLTVVGTVDVTGSITADSYIFSATKEIIKWIPNAVLANAISAGSYNGTSTATIASNGGSTISDYPTVTIGNAGAVTWELYIPIDPFIPNGASISQVLFYVENISISAASSVDFQVDIEAFNAAGTSSTTTTLGTDTASLIGSTGIRSLLTFTVNTSAINNDIVTGDCVRIKFAQIDASEFNVIAIFKTGLLLEVDSLAEAFGFE